MLVAISILVTIFFVILIFLLLRNLKLIDQINNMKQKNDFMLKARDHLLRSVNHELRAPLTRMKMDLEFLPSSEEKESISKDILYMQDLIEELMEIEKIKLDKTNKEEVFLNLLLQELVEKLKIDIDNLELDFQNEIYIHGIKYQLEKLFKNLIENAHKYKADDGKILIKLSSDQYKNTISIMNEGKHIPHEDLPYLFEPFFRVDKSRSDKKGLGLGLNICKEIIDQHNGKIQVTSKKDLGTIFKLSFNK